MTVTAVYIGFLLLAQLYFMYSLSTDLKRFRSYHGHTVRDLLRAMRNKV